MLTSGDEMVVTAYGNEFTNTFKKRDLDNGVIVTPSNYSQGLVYKRTTPMVNFIIQFHGHQT